MQENIPPYYSNPDNTHCCQCSLRMVFEHFNPNKSWTWEELCELSGKEPGLSSWPPRTYVELHNGDYDTVIYDRFDYKTFLLNPEEYLRDKFSPEYAREAIKYSNIPAVLKDVEKLLSNQNIKMRDENYDDQDIARFIDEGYLIIAWVDHAKIWNLRDQCTPHYVVIYDYDDQGVIMNDPGVEDIKTRQASLHVPWGKFNMANKMNAEGEVGEMFAIRPKKKAV